MHRNGHHAATTDVEVLRGWLAGRRNTVSGIVPAEGTLVLDVDPDEGGHRSLEDLEAKNSRLPPTTHVLTGCHRRIRGQHLWFHAEGIAAAKGMLARARIQERTKGYLVGPGSRHKSGVTYQLVGSPATLVDAPDWLCELVGSKIGKTDGPRRGCGRQIPVGRRHDTLISVAGALCRLGFGSEGELRSALGALADRFDNPDGEVEAEIDRIARPRRV